MLRSLKGLEHYKVSATDGDIGHVENFFIDDERWGVRYLIVNTGGLLEGRSVLISPVSFREVEWAARRFHLALTIDKIKDSPGIDVDKPVSRQHEQDYHGYFGYPYYWGYAGLWEASAYPNLIAANIGLNPPLAQPESHGDVHLRSVKEVRGYHVQGIDDAIGHVDDFIVDDQSWQVRYLVIDTSNWWFGRHVLVSPQWVNRVSWSTQKVHVVLPRQQVKDSPEWNPKQAINRDYEERLREHYGFSTYWDNGNRREREQQPHDSQRHEDNE